MLAFPIRLDGNGALATVDDASPQAAQQLARAVIATRPGERPLAPAYGIPDPSDGVDAGVVKALVSLCEPDIIVTDVRVEGEQVEVVTEWSQP